MGGGSGTRTSGKSGTRMPGKSGKHTSGNRASGKSGTRVSGKSGKSNLMSKSEWTSERRKMKKELAQLRRSLARTESEKINAQLRNANFAQVFLTYAKEPQGRKMLLQLPIHMRQSLSTMVQVGADLEMCSQPW